MAYSTVSQLGFMFLGLGAGREELAVFGATAAIFHLFTHAFFKALLFLASGSVMHAMGNVIDMRRFGGLRKVLPITHWTFAIGAAALAGLPPLSGFWSKDEILAAAQHSGHHYPIYMVLFWSATLTAFLTAFYTGRAYFRTFWGELVVPPEAGSHGHGDDHAHEDHGHAPAAHGDNHAHENHAHHGGPGVAHESPPVMTYPLIVLAIGAALVGLLLGPVTHWFPHFLERVPAYHEYLPHAEEHAMNTALLIQSALVAFAGLGLAWFFYVKNQSIPDAIGRSVPWLVEASRNRLYFDEIYNALLVLPATGFAHVASFFDGLIDGIVDLIARLPAVLARALRPIQNGLVQFYALAMILGTVMFIGILTLRGGR